MPNQKTTSEEWKKEEWGGWKIVSEMLDNPNELGIYPTSECYKKLYNFVMEQKQKARKEAIEAVLPDEKELPDNTPKPKRGRPRKKLCGGIKVEYFNYNFEGFNSCRSQIIQNAKEKLNIEIDK